MAVEATEDGYLAKITVPDGTEGVTVGTIVAYMTEEKDERVEIDIKTDSPAANGK